MTNPIEAVFHGGPHDGGERRLPEPYNRYVFPVHVPATAYWTEDDDYDPMPVDVYDLAHAYGAPSLDDQGRHRYQYRGRR